MRKFLIMILSLLLTMSVFVACGNNDNNEAAENNAADIELPEPDLDSIPNIVAEVNGEEITKEDFEGIYQQQFQQQSLQAQMSGTEIDEESIKSQTIEGLVGQILLTQEATSKFSEVSEEEIDNVLDNLLAQYGIETKEEMFEQLEEQGVSETDFMSDIEKQAKIERFITEEIGEINFSEDEIKEAYENVKAQQAEMEESDEEFPDYDEAKPILEEQLKSQKESEKLQEIVNKLREKADVTIHI